MTDEELLIRIGELSKEAMGKEKNFHDFAHVMNVYRNVEQLLKHEDGNRLVLLTAALLHDVKRDESEHAIKGACYARDLLSSISGFPQDLIISVVQAIEAHDGKKTRHTVEQKIFYDADKMDAFSELGVARAFMMYAKEGKTLREACEDYSSFIGARYERLYTQTAKNLIEKKYEQISDFASRLEDNYKSI